MALWVVQSCVEHPTGVHCYILSVNKNSGPTKYPYMAITIITAYLVSPWRLLRIPSSLKHNAEYRIQLRVIEIQDCYMYMYLMMVSYTFRCSFAFPCCAYACTCMLFKHSLA